MNKKVVAGLCVTCGLLAGAGMYLRDQREHQLVPILVAARDIPGRELLRAGDLEKVMAPSGAVDRRAVQDESQLIGKMLLSAVYAGEQIRPQRVTVSEMQLGPDDEAVAFKTDLVAAVGGLLQGGDVADVFLTVSLTNSKRVMVYKIASGVRVLSVRDASARATGPRANSDPAKQAGVAAVVVLKVPKEQVAVLRQAEQMGALTFAQVSPSAAIPQVPVFEIPDLAALMAGMPAAAPTVPSSKPPGTPGQ